MTVLGLLLDGIGQGSAYALVAVGLSLVLGSSGVIDFARGQLVLVGILVVFWLHDEHSLVWPLAIAGALAIPFVLGGIQERVAVWPLRGDSRASGWLVTTLGYGIVLQAALAAFFGGDNKNVTPLVSGTFVVGDIVVAGYLMVAAAVAVAAVGGTWAVLRFTSSGRQLRAVSEDRDAAALRGVNVTLVAVGTFCVAAALAGLAGVVSAPGNALVARAPLFTIKGFVAMVAGGTGSVWGALAGGWLVGCAETFGAHYVDGASQDVFGLAVLLLILMLRPQGLFASRRLRVA